MATHPVSIVPGHRSISPPTLRSSTGGGFMLLSACSQRWHAIQIVQACHYGHILQAVEVVWSPSAGAWEERGYFAIKEIDTNNVVMTNAQSVYENPYKEIFALQHLMENGPHPNVIELTEVLRCENSVYMIFPYCRGGELIDVVNTSNGGRLSEARAKTIFHDVLVGLSFVHGLGICHRDVRLENILLDSNGRANIIDFGLARAEHPVPPTGRCGNRCYIAPEVVMSGISNWAYDGFKVDVWACGIVLFMMLTGNPLFDSPIPEEDERCLMVAVNGRLRDLVAGWNLPVCEEAVDLVQSCLQFDSMRRPTIDLLLSHPWFAS